jgi:transposase-like protein
MPTVVAAHRSYKQTDAEALKMRFRARATLGLAVVRELDKPGVTIVKIAAELGVVDEQVRRYRQAYRDWVKTYPKEPLELD